MIEDLFFAAHDGLPREAPGSDATTELLLRLAVPDAGAHLAEPLRILDIGAGTGPATMVLAGIGAQVTAIDTYQPFLDELVAKTKAAGLRSRVTVSNMSMEDLDFPDHSFDLVWAEGAAYIIGFDNALASWRRLLAPGGALVLTEAEWLTRTPAPGAAGFWNSGYPEMRTTGENVSAAMGLGWTTAATYLLPETDWDEYYIPLALRIAELRQEHPHLAADLDLVGEEINIRRDHGTDYGYTGYVLRPREVDR
jgi:SAM-dependent methyltransferase